MLELLVGCYNRQRTQSIPVEHGAPFGGLSRLTRQGPKNIAVLVTLSSMHVPD